MKMRRIDIGTVKSVNPAKREVRVTTAGCAAEKLFSELAAVEFVLPDGTAVKGRVAAVRDDAGGKIIAMTPGMTRDTVGALKGARVLVTRVRVTAEPEAGGYELVDLNGMSVIDAGGGRIGEVTNIYAAGGNEAIEIERPDGSTLLVPLIEQVVESVDVERGEIVLRDIEPYAVEET